MSSELRSKYDATAALPPDAAAAARQTKSLAREAQQWQPYTQLDAITGIYADKIRSVPSETLLRTSETYYIANTHTERQVHVTRSRDQISYACENEATLGAGNVGEDPDWTKVRDTIVNDYREDGERAEGLVNTDAISERQELVITTTNNVYTIRLAYSNEAERRAVAFDLFSQYKLRNPNHVSHGLSVEFFMPTNRVIVTAKRRVFEKREATSVIGRGKLQNQVLRDFAETDRLTAVTLAALQKPRHHNIDTSNV